MDSQRVLEQISLARVMFADRPFWMFLAILLLLGIAATVARRLPARWTAAAARARSLDTPVLVLASAAITFYIAILIWYFSKQTYYDFAEPTIACLAWLFDRGQPIYHAFDAPERYSHMYGPFAFIIPGAFLAVAGPSLMMSKAAGVLAGLVSVAAVYRLARSATGLRQAIVLTGLFALLCLMYRNLTFWVRPDSLCLCFTSLALLASATIRRRWLAVMGVGLCTGVLIDLKITGALYALPAFGLLASRFGIGSVLVAGIGAGITTVLPFVVFSNVSLVNYVTWVRTSAKNGLLFLVLRQNVEWALFLLLPLAPTLLVAPPRTLPPGGRRWFYGAVVAGIAGVVIAASKPGAGSYHLMPFWPIIVYAVALHVDALGERLRSDAVLRRASLAFVAVAMLIAFVQQVYFIAVTKLLDPVDVVEDLKQVMAANPGRAIAMGYNNAGERYTFLRPLLVFQSGRYLIDPPALQEFQMSGIELPQPTLEAVRACDVEIWLSPRLGKPFDGPNKYPMLGYPQLFPDSFKQLFFERYEHLSNTRYFEVWRCRTERR